MELVVFSAIQGMSAIWDVRYWEVSLYLTLKRGKSCVRIKRDEEYSNTQNLLFHKLTQQIESKKFIATLNVAIQFTDVLWNSSFLEWL